VTTVLLIALLPPLLFLAFDRSERATREWRRPGMDTDVELLLSIRSGNRRQSSRDLWQLQVLAEVETS
jgi:hypothetical protein